MGSWQANLADTNGYSTCFTCCRLLQVDSTWYRKWKLVPLLNTGYLNSLFVTTKRCSLIDCKHERCLAVNDTILEYLDSCNYISASDNETLPCEAWEYNRTDYQSTIVTDARTILFYNLFYHIIVTYIRTVGSGMRPTMDGFRFTIRLHVRWFSSQFVTRSTIGPVNILWFDWSCVIRMKLNYWTFWKLYSLFRYGRKKILLPTGVLQVY